MGTRSVIARQEGDGFKGRYCHWDGYPSHMVPALWNVVAQTFASDVNAALRVLIEDNYGWLSIDERASANEPLRVGLNDGRFRQVEGVGIAYTTEQGQSSPDEWITHDGGDWGTEYAYALNDVGIAVFDRRWGTPTEDEGKMVGYFGVGAPDSSGYWKLLGIVRWDADASQFEQQLAWFSD